MLSILTLLFACAVEQPKNGLAVDDDGDDSYNAGTNQVKLDGWLVRPWQGGDRVAGVRFAHR